MTKSSPTYFAALALLFALILWGLSSLSHGPKPRSSDIASNEFSALRAFSILEDLVGNNKPHPSGSAENLRIRKTIEQKFLTLGYTPEIQSALGCTLYYPGCTQVENIIVRHKGSGNGDAIMLTTHYDSVPAGPAAADDGAGTAALIEIARIIKENRALKNDIIFLITDGEEGGLRGAYAFATQHPMMSDVKLVINLESRGVSGPSSMFETSDGNQSIIAKFASTNPHPVANSLSYEIYKRLPNDTDYSVYKKKGVAGLNFAFTGDVALYHSLRDDVAHLDKASLQHHGGNMLAAVKAFGDTDLNTLIGNADATYIDVFGKFLLNWPSKINLPVSALVFFIFIFVAFKSRIGMKSAFISIGSAIAICILTPAIGWLLSFPLGRWPDLFYLDHPHPWAGRLALIFGAIVSAWIVARLISKWATYNSLVWVAGLVFTIAALVLSVLMTGASYLVLLPALGIAIGLLIDIWRKNERFVVAAHMGIVIAAYMAFYHFIAFEVIAHYKSSHIRILPLILLALVLAPALLSTVEASKKTYGVIFAGLMSVFAIISALLPGFNSAHPRAQNLVYFQGHEPDKAIWVSETSGKQDEKFLSAAGFENPFKPKNLRGITWGRAVAKETKSRAYEQPDYIVQGSSVSDGIKEIILDIQSSHGGYALNMGFERGQGPLSVMINGQMAADYTDKPYRRPIAIRAPGKDVFHVVIRTKADQALKMALIDSFSLLPSQTDGMAALRPEISAPLHSGDRAHIYNLIEFACAEYCK